MLWEHRQSSPVRRINIKASQKMTPDGAGVRGSRVRVFADKAFHIVNHMAVADEERAALVQAFRNDIQNTFFTIARFAAGLFREERHRVALIQETQFSCGWLAVLG